MKLNNKNNHLFASPTIDSIVIFIFTTILVPANFPTPAHAQWPPPPSNQGIIPRILTNKPIITPTDRDIILNCVNIGPGKVDPFQLEVSIYANGHRLFYYKFLDPQLGKWS